MKIKRNSRLITFILLITCSLPSSSQSIIEHYYPAIKDSVRVGNGADDFMPYIEKGFTLSMPKPEVQGVLIFLEGSKYDEKNKNAKEIYPYASKHGFAVISVSSEIPLDFYFKEKSMLSTSRLLEEIFIKYQLPTTNIYFLGGSLVGHRAMQYIMWMKQHPQALKLQIQGIVLCNFTLDWTRKWYQHERDKKIEFINLWEPTFMNFMMESQLNGTPITAPENYHSVSPYSFYDMERRNTVHFRTMAVLAYIKPDIHFRLNEQVRTLYDNNATDVVGFLAELKLAGNQDTQLIILPSKENLPKEKSAKSSWELANKKEIMDWIIAQSSKSDK